MRITEEWEEPLRREARAAAARAAASADAVRLPVIPPVCPAVVSLIEAQFPSLIPNLAQFLSPVEAAGGDFPLSPVVLVAACPSQYTAAVRSSHTARLTVVSPAVMAGELRPHLAGARDGGASAAGIPSRGTEVEGELRVSGIRHVQKTLAEVETGALEGVRVLECYACDQGCVGSPLLGGDPFVAALLRDAAVPGPGSLSAAEPAAVRRPRPFAARRGARLDEDMAEAIRKLARIDALARSLAGRDCGVCGAPSCAAHAEDVVLGRAADGDCPWPRRTEERE